MAWLSGWSYRKQITITGQTGAGTNYQVKLLVGESSGASGENFDVENHSDDFPSQKDDSGDLRFTDNDETTLLDFWIEKVEGTTPNRVATVWIKVTDSLESNVNIYCYYGNSGASDVSNGENTFIFFDDFDDNSIDANKWTKHKELGTISEIGGYLECGGGSTSNPYGHTVLGSEDDYNTSDDDIALDFRLYQSSNAIAEVSIRGNYGDNDGVKGRWDCRTTGNEESFYDTPYSGWSGIGTTAAKIADPGSWVDCSLRITGDTIYIYYDGSQKNSFDISSYNTTGEISLQNHYGSYSRYDDVRVRKYISTEPNYNTSASEESTPSSRRIFIIN